MAGPVEGRVMTSRSSGTETPERPSVVTDYETVLQRSALHVLLGDHAKTRFLRALLASHPRPLNPSSIVESAGLGSRSSWYDHRDDLLATGLVVEAGSAGNSPLYGLAADDERVGALRTLYDLTGAALRREQPGE